MNFLARETLTKGNDFLKKAGIENPSKESILILKHVIRKSFLHIITNKDENIGRKKRKTFFKKVYKRLSGKPITRIDGQSIFYSKKFFINSFTLDPRPETEILVETILEVLKVNQFNRIKILDLGTGSGCVLISVILNLIKKLKISGEGIDISERALEIAKKNANRHNVSRFTKFYQSNWFLKINKKYEIIVSNPPYIPELKIKELKSEVKNHDPFISLNGGIDGLQAYRKIANKAKFYLKKKGFIFLEIGENQKKQVKEIFEKEGFELFLVKKDLNQEERIMVLKKKN